MDKILRATLLYDFYGCLLTEKQKLFYEAHYLNDLSLSEIGQDNHVSPQAVGDLLKRTTKNLEVYESKLGLLAQYEGQKKTVQSAAASIDALLARGGLDGQASQALQLIQRQLYELIV